MTLVNDERPDRADLVGEATVEQEELLVRRDTIGAFVVVPRVTVEAEQILEHRFVHKADDTLQNIGEGIFTAVRRGQHFADGREDVA